MNQQTQPPQNRAPGQGPQAPRQPQLLRPEQMRTFSYLDAADKAKYEAGLKQLWAKVDSSPVDSPEHTSAKHKIAEFSRMVIEKMKKLHQLQLAQRQQQGSQQGQQSAGAQPQSLPGAAAPPPNPAARPQQSAAAAMAPTGTPGSANPPPKGIMEHVQKFPWNLLPVPSQCSTPEQIQKFLQETKAQYARALMNMEGTNGQLRRIDALIKERLEKNNAGQETIPEELADQKTKLQKNYKDASMFIQKIRNQVPTPTRAQGAAAAQQARAGQPMQPTNSGGVASTHPMQDATASINAAINAARAVHRGSIGGVPSPQQSQPQTEPASQQPQTPATPATPSTNAPGQAPQSVAVPNAPVKIEPGVNPQHPPPVNTTLSAASSANLPSAGTPTHPSARGQTPQSAQPSSVGATVQPRPLTHAAAVNRANSSSNIAQAVSASSGAVGNNNTNGPAPMVNNATPSAHTHAHPQPTPTLTSKLPIPKVLPEKAQMPPVPVATGGGNTPGRPSYGGGSSAGGVQNQPVLPKIQVPQYDTEGDHVLSKKKLDELVRQVCGGASPGADGNYLTPDVEESVLNVADNFVDNVLSMACRLAKERGSKVLEIRDIQLVLERVYNIRIPGYTSDELRTVRKVQPAASWIQKMSAIQAAKVTSNKDDK
ncbi:hypothetical protein F5Y18DRAFT_412464 [Xylariaceae sp. FL1019]|nr:hypothetical protein F5Y18DRAFT_412464 [Xylariaceae sp. FL1019]